jgi:hypothetical protein
MIGAFGRNQERLKQDNIQKMYIIRYKTGNENDVFHSLYDHCVHRFSNGTVTGTAQTQQFPNAAIFAVWFKANYNNKGVIFIGVKNNADFPLLANDDTGWFCADNLSDFYYRYLGKDKKDKTGLLHFWCAY